MQNNVTQIKCIINQKEIVITCPIDTSTVEMKEGLFQFMKYIGKVEDTHLEMLQKEQEVPSEEETFETEPDHVQL